MPRRSFTIFSRHFWNGRQTRPTDLSNDHPFTIMSHYTEDQLSEYVLRREGIDDPQSIEQHLANCAECRKALDLVATFDDALRDPLAWQIAGSMAVRREAP